MATKLDNECNLIYLAISKNLTFIAERHLYDYMPAKKFEELFMQCIFVNINTLIHPPSV